MGARNKTIIYVRNGMDGNDGVDFAVKDIVSPYWAAIFFESLHKVLSYFGNIA